MKPFPAFGSGVTLILMWKVAVRAPAIIPVFQAVEDFPEVAHNTFTFISFSRIWSYIHTQMKWSAKAKGDITFILGTNVECRNVCKTTDLISSEVTVQDLKRLKRHIGESRSTMEDILKTIRKTRIGTMVRGYLRILDNFLRYDLRIMASQEHVLIFRRCRL